MIGLFCYLVLINLTAAFAAWQDKRRSRRNGWRIPEKTLFLLAGMGGAAGMLLTMKTIHHKTKHKRFMVGLPVLLAFQAAAVFWACLAVLL